MFRTFWRFSGWIWVKLAPVYSKRHLKHDSMPFFPLASHFTTFLLRHAQKSKFWGSDLSLRAFRFFDFFCLSFFSFSFLLLQWLSFYCSCFQLKKFWESTIKTGNFYHGVAKCSPRKFCSESFPQHFWSLFFRAYSWLNWANHSDLDIIGKIVSSHRSWAKMMPILVKGNDDRSGTKAKARCRRLQAPRESIG